MYVCMYERCVSKYPVHTHLRTMEKQTSRIRSYGGGRTSDCISAVKK